MEHESDCFTDSDVLDATFFVAERAYRQGRQCAAKCLQGPNSVSMREQRNKDLRALVENLEREINCCPVQDLDRESAARWVAAFLDGYDEIMDASGLLAGLNSKRDTIKG